jgi:hypothetical protein
MTIAKLFANSRQVSMLLSSFNPEKLPFDTILKIFNQHNQYVIDMIKLHGLGKYEEEVKIFDEYYHHILMMSDTLHDALMPMTQSDDKDKNSQKNREARLFTYPEGVILQAADMKEITNNPESRFLSEIAISRKAGSISKLIRQNVIEDPKAVEDTKEWDDQKLQNEPLLEIEIPVNYKSKIVQIVVDYMNHFNGDDSKVKAGGEWEKSFIRELHGDVTLMKDIFAAANYFGIESLASLVSVYINLLSNN